MNRRISVRAIVLLENKLLCCKIKPAAMRTGQGTYWCLPGGGLEEGEDIRSGLAREMIEETGVRPTIGNLLYIQQFKDDHTEYLEFFFEVTNGHDYLDIDFTQTTHGAIELDELAYIDPTDETILPAFLKTEPLTHDAQDGRTRIFNYLP